MKLAITTLVALAMLAPAHAQTGARAAELEAFMNDYLVLWNKHDAATISQRVYRLDGDHPWNTEAGLKAEFDRLKAQGYDKSDITSVKGCRLTDDTGDVELRYSRLKTDGTPMPPKDRASIYHLKKFADGWRVTGMKGLAATSKMECPVN